jgi:hypothetical protein
MDFFPRFIKFLENCTAKKLLETTPLPYAKAYRRKVRRGGAPYEFIRINS